MRQYSFKSHTTTLNRDGFVLLPEEVIETCKEAVVFYKYNGVFVLCDVDAFCEFRDTISEIDDRNMIALRRHIFNSSAYIETIDDLVVILWDLINRYVSKYAESRELEIEMCPYNMVFYGKESKNQFVEIKILDNGEQKLEQ